MTGGLENRPQIKGIHTQLLHVIQPGVKRFNSIRRLEIIPLRCAAKAEGINMIEGGVLPPKCVLGQFNLL